MSHSQQTSQFHGYLFDNNQQLYKYQLPQSLFSQSRIPGSDTITFTSHNDFPQTNHFTLIYSDAKKLFEYLAARLVREEASPGYRNILRTIFHHKNENCIFYLMHCFHPNNLKNKIMAGKLTFILQPESNYIFSHVKIMQNFPA